MPAPDEIRRIRRTLPSAAPTRTGRARLNAAHRSNAAY